MNITDVFIRRPVLATVVSLIVLLVGLLAYSKLPIFLLPKMEAASAEVYVEYPGADSELVEGFVTSRIESALNGIEGVDYIFSNSYQGSSKIEIFFKVGSDVNTAVAEVRAKVAAVRGNLPPTIHDPVISKIDPNSKHTLLFMGFTSQTVPPEQITDYVVRMVQPALQTITGVADVGISGSLYSMNILLNPFLMAAHWISAPELYHALNSQSLQAPAGQIETAMQLLNVKTLTEVNTEKQFNNLVIKEKNGTLTRLQDVGFAQLGLSTKNSSAFLDGQPLVMAEVFAAPNADWFGIGDKIHQIFPEIQHSLPKGVTASIFWEDTVFIKNALNKVHQSIIESTISVVIVMFLFLGSWRAVLIPLVTIPLSLFGVCAIMWMMGYSLNIISFYALTLSIGVIVDDAIVVMENIHRHMQTGKSRFDSAIIGAREIQFAIISMTFTLAAAYTPIGLLSGAVGALFKEFAFTLASVVIVSGFIALTLSPMMCSNFLQVHASPKSFAARTDHFFTKITSFYRYLLIKVLQFRKWVLFAIVVVLLACSGLYKILPSEFAPNEDLMRVFLSIQGPTTASLAYTEKYTSLLLPIVSALPEYKNFFIRNENNHANAVLVLTPWEERKRSVLQIMQELRSKFATIPGVQISMSFDSSAAGGGKPIVIGIQTMGEYSELYAITQKMLAAVKENPLLTDIDTSMHLDQNQLRINIDRNKAGTMGISMADIGDTINLAIGKPTIGYFSILGRSYSIVPQLEEQFYSHPDILNNLYLNTASGDLVSLANLITINEKLQPQSLQHYQQMRVAELYANLAPSYSLGEALQYIEKTAKKILPPHMQLVYGGQSRQYLESGHEIMFTFGIAIIFIFLVLAAQFESFRSPFIVLFSVPLSMFGALLALFLTNNTINIYSQIGFITLIGLITKHGILMVEFANQLQTTGKNIHDAIIEAATVRLRPILMTTAAVLAGAIPLAFAHGFLAASNHQIGWVIVGGMLIGTLFTLFVVPTIYTYIKRR